MKILVLGDVMGKIGRRAVAAALPDLRKTYAPDLVIANGENLAHGKGMTVETVEEIFAAGVDLLTGGNHSFSANGGEVMADPKYRDRALRPANYPIDNPGVGVAIVPTGAYRVLVINLLCRVFIPTLVDDPFRSLDRILDEHRGETFGAILVDLHGEASSERNAFGWYADGRVSAVWGTHTHIPTSDERVLPGGTGFTTDVGMTGARDSVIGEDPKTILTSFLRAQPFKHEIPESGVAIVNAIVLEIDPKTRQTIHIERIRKEVTI